MYLEGNFRLGPRLLDGFLFANERLGKKDAEGGREKSQFYLKVLFE